jgi:hypothetical protein
MKVPSEPVFRLVVEGNRVAARQGGKQPEMTTRPQDTNSIRPDAVANLLVKGEA